MQQQQTILKLFYKLIVMSLKVDRQDHFWRPRLPSYYNMCFPGVQSLKFRLKNWMLPMFEKTQNESRPKPF